MPIDTRTEDADVRGRRIALRVLYWLAVLIISLVIVFGLVLLFESLDDSSVDQGSMLRPLFRL